MAFGVFVQRATPSDQKRPTEHYHFSAECLPQASRCINDWVLLYEPVKMKASRGYYAIARVRKIIRDPVIAGRCLAAFEPGSYLDFIEPVSLARVKAGATARPNEVVGRIQADVRLISSADFLRVIEMGYGRDDPGAAITVPERSEFLADDPAPFELESVRARIVSYNHRLFRDKAFRAFVLGNYGDRCLISGQRFTNDVGQTEAEAAHIVPVSKSGSDSVMNGLALSRTVHWLFDSGMLSLTDDLEILVARRRPGYDDPRSVVNSTGRLLLPRRAPARPHPRFLQWHRDHCFRS